MPRRANGRKKARRPLKRRRRWLLILFLLGLATAVAGLGVATGLVMGALRTVPEVTNPIKPNLPSVILDARGEEITRVYEHENREYINIDNIPVMVQNAFVAVEDERFWNHPGVDLVAIARALYNDLRNRDIQGGSTITQQLARNAFPIGFERTIQRKAQEAILAIELERRYTKKEILEMYLNQIFFGRDAYGIKVAAKTYFGKEDLNDLTLVEAATLAGLPQAPSLYEPVGNPERARQRRNIVLDQMARNGFITPEEARETKAEPLKTVDTRRYADYPAPHFVDYVLSQLLKEFKSETVYRGGLKVKTTLNMEVQRAAEEAIAKHLADYPLDGPDEPPQAAAVFIDPQTGYVLAMVGGRSHERVLELNRAWYDPDAGCCARQPGSSIKPLAVYLPALMNGFTPGSVIADYQEKYPTPEGDWKPKNFDDIYRGPTTVREAVRRSVNVAAVKTLKEIGPLKGLDLAEQMGLTTLVRSGTLNDVNLSLALGGLTRGTAVVDMARAYAAIANGGQRVEAIAILEVRDRSGNILEENRPRRTRVIRPEYAYLMTDILRSTVEPQSPIGWVFDSATGRNARIPALDEQGEANGYWPTAGKTGTTSDARDVWFVGFTPRYAGAVWIGHDNRLTAGSLPRTIWSGGQPALIFRDVMAIAHRGMEPVEFTRPAGAFFVNEKIAINTGKQAGPDTPPAWTREELFIRGTQPTEVDDSWTRATVCQEDPTVLFHPICGCTPQEIFFPTGSAASAIPLPADVPRMPEQSCLGPGDDLGIPDGGWGGWLDGPMTDMPETNGPEVDLTLTMSRSGMNPAILRAHVGQRVRLLVGSTDVDHRLRLYEFGLDVVVPAGGTATVEFTPDREGVFILRCGLHLDELARFVVTPD